MSADGAVLEARGMVRTYRRGDFTVPVLKGLDLEVRRGEWVACTGRSGSGKSTLLNVLGLLDSADAGTYVLAGHDVSDLDDGGRAQLRNRLLGFVFQLHNLLPRTTALENVATPLVYRGVRRAERLRRAAAALEAVGLADRADHDPSELSGGQMQRVAIARALVGDPEVLLVDEPTGNLDLTATREVLEILDRLHADGRTIFMITHEEDVAEHADRRLRAARRQAARPRFRGGTPMKSFDRRLPGPRSPGRRNGVLIVLVLAAAAGAAALAAGCGSSGSTPAAAAQGGSATSIQVLTPVRRGDLAQSAMGSVKLVVTNGKNDRDRDGPEAVRRLRRSRADGDARLLHAAAGRRTERRARSRRIGGRAARPSRRGRRPGGFRASPRMTARAGLWAGKVRRRGTPGTVTAVTPNADGSAAVTITVKKLPANATAKSVGFASIQTKVLASNVIIIPTAAIKGSGSSATVQVLSGGKTSTVSVVVGQQAGAESEIVSGLSVGENIVWTRSFRRGGFFRGGSPFPGQGQQGFGGGQSGGGFQ